MNQMKSKPRRWKTDTPGPSSPSLHFCSKARVVELGISLVSHPVVLRAGKKKRWSAADTVREFGETALAERIEEIFVVRHAIAHAHLWKAKVSHDLRFIELPTRLPGYGDKNFDKLVDPRSRTTRKLNLDVFPPRIHHGTAIIVLKECVEALESLESKHEAFLKLALRQVQFRDKFVTFYR
jgi:hypothetical protein